MRLQAYLRRTGTSVAWLAREVGISRPHLSMAMAGQRTLLPEYRERVLAALRGRQTHAVTDDLFETEDDRG